jgi:uncharacterized protein involved in outer membrane biogenesis
MRAKRVFKWAIITAVTLVAVAGILLFTLDLGFLHGTVEKRLSQSLGRELTIGGPLSIRLGRNMVIDAGNLALQNADWLAGEEFIGVGNLHAVVDLWSAWRGPLLIRRIELDGVQVSLVQDDRGRANWQLGPPGADGEPESAEPPFLVETLSITNAVLAFRSPRLDRPLRATVSRMEHSLQQDGLVHSTLIGTLNERPVDLAGTAGPYARLIKGDDVSIELDGTFGSIRLAGQAVFDSIRSPRRPTIELQVNGPDLEELTGMLGIEGLGGGDLSLHLVTQPSGDGLNARLEGRLGQFDTDIDTTMSSLADITSVGFEARVGGPNFGRLAALAGFEGWPAEPFQLSGEVSRPGEAVLIERFNLSVAGALMNLSGNIPAFPDISGAELELRVDGPDLAPFSDILGLENVVTGAFSIAGGISSSGDATSLDLGFETPLGSGTVSGVIGAGERMVGTDLAVSARGLDASALGDMLEIPGLAAAPWTYRMEYSIEHPDYFSLRNTAFGTTGLTLEIQGRLGTESLAEHSDFQFSVQGDRLADFRAFAGENLALPEVPFEVGGRAKSATGAWELSDVAGHAGSSAFSLGGRLAGGPGWEGTDLRFTVSGERLAELQGLAGEAVALPELPFTIGGRVAAAEGGWDLAGVSGNVGATRFDLDGRVGMGALFEGTDLLLGISGTDAGRMIELPGEARLPEGPFDGSLRIGLKEGRLAIGDADFKAGPFSLKLDADIPWPLDLSNGRFALDVSGVNIARILPELAGLTLDEEDYQVTADGQWQEGIVTMENGLLRIGESTLSAKGTLDMPPNLSATDLHVELHSPDLSRLGTIDGERWGSVPLELLTTFTGTPTRFEMNQFRARLGESSIRGVFAMDFEPEKPRFDLRLSTTVLNLKPFQVEPEEPGATGEAEPAKDDRIISDAAFPMQALARVNGKFAISADRILTRRLTLNNNALIGEIRDGALRISDLGADGYGGRLLATLSLEPSPGAAAKLAATVSSTGLVLEFTDQSEEEKAAYPPLDIDIELEGSGTTVREAAAALNGSITVYSPGGTVNNVAKGAVRHPFLAQVVSAISPSASRKDVINISCLAAVVNAKEGVLQLDPGIALQSDQLNIFARGRVNLSNEKLDINLRTQTRKTIDLSVSEVFSPYVKLSGTLASPKVAIDPKGTLLSGGAAYLSGGLSILAKKALDQLGGTKNPCTDFLAKVPENP